MGNDKLENTLIHNRAMKGNGFDAELTSQRTSKTSKMQSSLDVNPLLNSFPSIAWSWIKYNHFG